jgi:hypothetical protein
MPGGRTASPAAGACLLRQACDPGRARGAAPAPGPVPGRPTTVPASPAPHQRHAAAVVQLWQPQRPGQLQLLLLQRPPRLQLQLRRSPERLQRLARRVAGGQRRRRPEPRLPLRLGCYQVLQGKAGAGPAWGRGRGGGGVWGSGGLPRRDNARSRAAAVTRRGGGLHWPRLAVHPPGAALWPVASGQPGRGGTRAGAGQAGAPRRGMQRGGPPAHLQRPENRLELAAADGEQLSGCGRHHVCSAACGRHQRALACSGGGGGWGGTGGSGDGVWWCVWAGAHTGPASRSPAQPSPAASPGHSPELCDGATSHSCSSSAATAAQLQPPLHLPTHAQNGQPPTPASPPLLLSPPAAHQSGGRRSCAAPPSAARLCWWGPCAPCSSAPLT